MNTPFSLEIKEVFDCSLTAAYLSVVCNEQTLEEPGKTSSDYEVRLRGFSVQPVIPRQDTLTGAWNYLEILLNIHAVINELDKNHPNDSKVPIKTSI